MKKVLITGGAGFIGTHLASAFINEGTKLTVLDNLSRRGSSENVKYLKKFGGFQFVKGDIRNPEEIMSLLRKNDFDIIIHLASQVSVVNSLNCPEEDFRVNALGTLNLLESIRKIGCRPNFIYSSTNKVYGNLFDTKLRNSKKRYFCDDLPVGISEDFAFFPNTPYACSKGIADLYAQNYFLCYGIPTMVLRQSCIYGPRQFGFGDQGWVGWFTFSSLLNEKINIYGNGKQVRDLLYISDLVELYKILINKSKLFKGKIYNIGGGFSQSLSVLETIKILEKLIGHPIKYDICKKNAGDQDVYYTDIRKITRETGWKPKIKPTKGLEYTCRWGIENLDLIKSVKSR